MLNYVVYKIIIIIIYPLSEKYNNILKNINLTVLLILYPIKKYEINKLAFLQEIKYLLIKITLEGCVFS